MSAPVELEGSVGQEDLERLVTGDYHDPHQILGPHLQKDGDRRVRVVLRGWCPDAVGMAVLTDGARMQVRRIHAVGVVAGVPEPLARQLNAWITWRATCSIWRRASGSRGMSSRAGIFIVVVTTPASSCSQ